MPVDTSLAQCKCFLYMRLPRYRYGFAAFLPLIVGALSYFSAPRQADPWLGTWHRNVEASEVSAAPRYKRVTTRIEPWQEGLKVSYDMVGIRGGVTHTEWTGRFDGKDYPMHGLDYVMTNAYRKIDARSYEIVIKIDGTITAIALVVVSPDGKTLSVSTEQKTGDGKTSKTTAVYQRQ